MPEFLKKMFRVGEQKASPKKVLDYSGLSYLSRKLENKYIDRNRVPYAFESMTQSDYDHLRVKDSQTVYLIVDQEQQHEK